MRLGVGDGLFDNFAGDRRAIGHLAQIGEEVRDPAQAADGRQRLELPRDGEAPARDPC
jgi:hypothetical protein